VRLTAAAKVLTCIGLCCCAAVTCLGISAASTVVSGAEDGSVRLSNVDTGKVLGQAAGKRLAGCRCVD
jgi:hypothetical protein